MRDWDPNVLPETTKADILSALEAWRAVSIAYAQIKSALFDLVWKLCSLPDYGRKVERVELSGGGRRAALRNLALTDGPLSVHRNHVLELLGWLDRYEQELDLLTTSAIEVRVRRSGQISLLFEMVRDRRRLTTDGLRSRAKELSRVLQFGAGVLRDVRRQVEAH